MKRNHVLCGSASVLALLFAGATPVQNHALAQGGGAQAPRLDVDPLWPKPLGNHQILGSVTGVTVDAQNHIWVTHRGLDSLGGNEKGPTLTPPASQCCFAAPAVLEFDQPGNLIGHWGGPGQGYQWPQAPSGIAVDSKGNVWVAGAGVDPPPAGRGRGGPGGGRAEAPAAPVPGDAHVLKFSRTGQFLLQIGAPGKMEGPDSQTTLNRPTMVAYDAAANEIYVADGGNRRVVVFDADKGTYKRHWGAYGEKPGDAPSGPYDPAAPPPRQFRDVSCVKISRDNQVYVCDRRNDRIQVFQIDGKFVTEAIVSRTTLGDGAVWDVAFSSDPQQQFVFVADGHDKKVLILQRGTLQQVGSFGDGGRLPGRFYAVGSVSVDAQGNVYTGENLEGKRVQKWLRR